MQDEENSDVDRANGNQRGDYSRKKFSDYEADRGGKDRSSGGRKRRSKKESDRGRGRYEDGAEKYEEKRRRYGDDEQVTRDQGFEKFDSEMKSSIADRLRGPITHRSQDRIGKNF